MSTYVKNYDDNGVLTNPITRLNPHIHENPFPPHIPVRTRAEVVYNKQLRKDVIRHQYSAI